MLWAFAGVADGIVAAGYLAISITILGPLIRDRQVLNNMLGLMTALIFLTAAVHFGSVGVHMLLPYASIEVAQGMSLRGSWDVEAVLWDVLCAFFAVGYWLARRNYGARLTGGALFENFKESRQRALHLNDAVVQGLATARMAWEMGDQEQLGATIDETLAHARQLVSSQLVDVGGDGGIGAGDLRTGITAATGKSR